MRSVTADLVTSSATVDIIGQSVVDVMASADSDFYNPSVLAGGFAPNTSLLLSDSSSAGPVAPGGNPGAPGTNAVSTTSALSEIEFLGDINSTDFRIEVESSLTGGDPTDIADADALLTWDFTVDTPTAYEIDATIDLVDVDSFEFVLQQSGGGTPGFTFLHFWTELDGSGVADWNGVLDPNFTYQLRAIGQTNDGVFTSLGSSINLDGQFRVVAVPEPGSMGLIAFGVAVSTVVRRRRR